MEQGRRWKKTALLSPQAFSAARRQFLAALPAEGPAVIEVPLLEKAALVLQTSRCDSNDPGHADDFGRRRRALAEILYYFIEHSERVNS